MQNVTKQQALNRWDKLPVVLREAIFSERNTDILWIVCEDQHLPEDKIFRVASLVGDVVMGFTHPDDLGKEIKETLALNPIIIDLIVKEVNSKIFAPIRSEINKALALPILTEEEIEAEEAAEKAKETEEPTVSDIIKEGVKYTKPEGIEAESIKIIGVEKGKEIVIPKGIEMAEGPVIIHKEEEFKSVMGSKKSLGELFGFLGGKEIKKEAPTVAKIEIGEKDIPLKEILESKPEVNFPLDLLHIKPPMIAGELISLKADKLKSLEEKNKDISLIFNRDTIDIQLPKEKISEEKPRVVHYTDLPDRQAGLKTSLPEIKQEIKLEAKQEAKPFEIKIEKKPVIEPLIIGPIKEIPKEKVKIVDFTAEAIIPKKTEIVQDIAPKIEIAKIEPIEKIEPLMSPIKPKKKKGFFSSLFRRKEKIAVEEKFILENKQQSAIDKPIIKLVKEQVKK